MSVALPAGVQELCATSAAGDGRLRLPDPVPGRPQASVDRRPTAGTALSRRAVRTGRAARRPLPVTRSSANVGRTLPVAWSGADVGGALLDACTGADICTTLPDAGNAVPGRTLSVITSGTDFSGTLPDISGANIIGTLPDPISVVPGRTLPDSGVVSGRPVPDTLGRLTGGRTLPDPLDQADTGTDSDSCSDPGPGSRQPAAGAVSISQHLLSVHRLDATRHHHGVAYSCYFSDYLLYRVVIVSDLLQTHFP